GDPGSARGGAGRGPEDAVGPGFGDVGDPGSGDEGGGLGQSMPSTLRDGSPGGHPVLCPSDGGAGSTMEPPLAAMCRAGAAG
ncbi:hypothetical protein QPM16_20635, partial [Streptomyces anulatus]